MAFKLPSRVKETTTTTGTGSYALGGAVAGFVSFASALSASDTCFYYAEGGSSWEVGLGTYSAGTLARTTILASSNSGNAVNWTTGEKTLSIGLPGPSDLDATNLGRLQGALGVSTFMQGLLDDADAAAARTTLSVRERLAANRTYYVRTDGDDDNDGLSDSSGRAFLTIQKAIDTAAALDLSIYNVTIQVGDGTYTGANTLKSFLGNGTITIQGDTSTPSNVVVNPTSATCFSASGVIGTYAIRGFKLQTTTSGNCITVSNGSIVQVGEIAFGAVSANNYHMQAATQGRLSTLTGYAVSGGGFAHMGAETGGLIVNVNKTVVLTGTFAFHGSSGGFAYAGLGGGIYCNNTWDISAATVTGKRYNASMNAWINTLGGGASFFPGDVGGTTATGGQYQ